MLPCFQLLRMGVGRGGDLYTFHPPTGAGCTYHLGLRADLCDVALRPQCEPVLISPVHAKLHAEGQGDDWRVSLEDCSSYGTLVNNIRLPRGHQLELSDGDLLTFGPKGPVGASPPEFYFMFQRVRVRPQDFAAITIPRAGGESGGEGGFWPMLPPQGAPQRPLSTLSPAPKATLILSSIGSLSKLQPQPLTFSRVGGGGQSLTFPVTFREAGATLPTPPPAPRNRRKSAHKVLAELEDEGGTEENPPRVQAETRKKPRGMKIPVTPCGKRRGRPRKYLSSRTAVPPPVGGGEPCAAPSCQPPQEETVAWVQCDGCDEWFHVACAGCSYRAAQEADYRCSSCQA
ncbi:transcription factor 19 [Vombatus ursinus]|uniref:Transcription factor 19 n=1 Tax=Vombatus ursinus TaxID=29139 RepID=A0A4X2JZ25_VOMUR|nr:transcription factor 19 [Vombatus ursinus]